MSGQLDIELSVKASMACRRYLSSEKSLLRAFDDCSTAAKELHDLQLPRGNYVVDHDFLIWILVVGESGDVSIARATQL